jgi:hypothetical protein
MLILKAGPTSTPMELIEVVVVVVVVVVLL